MTLFFDDLVVGTVERFGRYEITREEVIAFAQRYDPQPFHLSDEGAAGTLFGRVAASGWNTAAATMRMIVEHWKATGRDKASLGGIGTDELRWLKPVYPGDTLRCESEILEKRRSGSRPEMGIIKTRMTVFNQHDEPVMTMRSAGLIRVRDAGGRD